MQTTWFELVTNFQWSFVSLVWVALRVRFECTLTANYFYGIFILQIWSQRTLSFCLQITFNLNWKLEWVWLVGRSELKRCNAMRCELFVHNFNALNRIWKCWKYPPCHSAIRYSNSIHAMWIVDVMLVFVSTQDPLDYLDIIADVRT